MRKWISFFILLSIIFSSSACKTSKDDIRKANDYLSDLGTFDTSDFVSSSAKFADLTAAVINLPADVFNYKSGWSKKSNEYEKYIYIFNSDSTMSVYTGSGKIGRVTYTFKVDSVKSIYKSADELIAIYGKPETVYLNGSASSHAEVDQATNKSDDSELTYSYVWKTKLQGQTIYVYEAYYNASGTNFSYVVVSNYLNTTNNSQNSMWN